MDRSGFARGIGFALMTAALWGFLPILMKIALRDFSAGNIVWFRFTFAFFVLFLILFFQKKKPGAILRQPPLLGICGGLCLAANYFYFVLGVKLSSPSNAGILIQLAPVLVVIIGVTVFKERFNRAQGIGLGLAVIGLVLFFRDQSGQALDPEKYATAYFYVFLAAVTWALYLTFQKQLSVKFEAQQLNLLVYGTAAVGLAFTVHWPGFEGHSLGSWALMIFLGINTLLAYGCLAEAVKYIPISLISVIIVINPFITIAAMQVLPSWMPQWLEPEMIGGSGFIGAFTAIAGVMMVIHQQHREKK